MFNSSEFDVSGTKVAEMTIDGLAVCLFNGAQSLWEVAFLRSRCHNLTLAVEEYDAGGVLLDVNSYNIRSNVRSIDIRPTKGSDAHLGQHPNGAIEDPNFSRNGPDSKAIQWAINFTGSEPGHGNFTGLKRGTNVTLLRVRHSLFYTVRVTREPVVLAPAPANDPQAGAVLGRANEDIGATLLATGPSPIEIAINPPVPGIPTSLPAGRFYLLHFENMDSLRPTGACAHVKKRGYVRGDFRQFYEVINVSGTQRDLWAVERRTRTIEGDCHPVTGGHPNLPSFAPLIEP